MIAKRVWIVSGGVAAAIALAVLAAARLHGSTHDGPPAPPAVGLAKARFGTFDERVDAQGRVGAPAGSTSSFAFGVNGTIRSIDVRVGDRVVAGQALAHLDDTPFAIAVAQAQGDARSASSNYGGGAVPAAALASARERARIAHDYLARLEQDDPASRESSAAAVAGTSQADLKVDADRRALAREQALYAGGIAAAKDVDAARSQLEADEADARALHAKTGTASAGGVLAQARADYDQALSELRAAEAQTGNLAGQAQHADAALAQAQSDLAKTVLRSPVDGVVTGILKHVGETADVSTPVVEVGPGEAAASTLSISAADARGIKRGDPVQLRLVRSQATVATVVSAVVPSVDPATQMSTVVVDGVPAGALPGDAVRASILIARRHGIIVPAAAVVQDPQSGQTLVFVRRSDGDGFVAREVAVAASDDTSALITRGLSGGESVAAHGAYELMAPPSD